MIAGHAVLLPGGSLQDLPHRLHPGAAVGAGDRVADRDGGLRLRGLRRRGRRPVRALARHSICCSSGARGPGAREGGRRRTDQLDVRHEGMLGLLLETLTLRDPPPPATPRPSPTTRTSSPARRACPSATRGRPTAACCTTSARRRWDHLLSAARSCTGRAAADRAPSGRRRAPAVRVEGLGEVATAVLAHHERVDGQGYPDGLVGDDIRSRRASCRSPRSTTC